MRFTNAASAAISAWAAAGGLRALVFGLTMVKVREGASMEAFDHAATCRSRPSSGGN
jgi:hypothetical protein